VCGQILKPPLKAVIGAALQALCQSFGCSMGLWGFGNVLANLKD